MATTKPKKGSLEEVTRASSTDALTLALRYASSLVPTPTAVIGPDDKGNLFVYSSDGTASVRVVVRDPGFAVDAPFSIEIDTLRKALSKRSNAKVKVADGILTVTAAGYETKLTVEDAAGDFTVQPPNKDGIVSSIKMSSDLWSWLQTVTSKLSIVDLNLGIEPMFFCRVTDKAAVAAALDDTQASFTAVKTESVGAVPSETIQFMLPNNFFARLVKAVPYDNTSITITESSVFLTMRSLRAQLALTAAESNITPEAVLEQIKQLPKIDGADVSFERLALDTFIENADALSMNGERVVTFTKGGKGTVAVCKAANGTVKATVGGTCPVTFKIDLKLLMGVPKEGNDVNMRVAKDGSVAVVKSSGSLPYYYATTLVGE